MKQLFIFLCLLLINIQSAYSQVSARVDTNNITLDDTLVLTISVEGDSDGEPDVSGLEKDFDILGTATSSNISIVNGTMKSKKEWNITLIPEKKGTFIIPAITVGNESTKAIEINVVESKPVANGKGDTVFITTSVDKVSPYVQSKVIYTAKLYYRVQARGELVDPKIDNVLISHAGEDKSYNEKFAGETYRVLERNYILIPQSSGELTIPGPTFVGQVPDGGRSTSSRIFPNFGQMFQSMRQLRRRGNDIKINVLPEPSGSTASNWLPAEQLSIQEVWATEPPVFKVGEPVTRTIIIAAQGVDVAQLPDLEFPEGDNYRVYADKPVTDSASSAGNIISRKDFNVAIVPSAAGDLVLPEISITWWDIINDRQQQAILPERTYTVEAGVASEPLPAVIETPPVAVPEKIKVVPQQHAVEKTQEPDLIPKSDNLWFYISIGLFALWILTVLLFMIFRRKPEAKKSDVTTVLLSPEKYLKKIRVAIKENDITLIRDSLLEWAAVKWPDSPPLSLTALASRLPQEAAVVISDLDKWIYTGQGEKPQLDNLVELLKPIPDNSEKDVSKPDVLPPLYPSQSQG